MLPLPYLRYARVQSAGLPRREVVGLDHRLFYLPEGDTCIRADGRDIPMRAGDLLFIRAGVPYRNAPGAAHPSVLAFNFDLVYSEDAPRTPVSYLYRERYCPEALIERELPPALAALPAVCHASLLSVGQELRELIREYEGKRPYAEERSAALLLGVLSLLFRRSTESGRSPSAARAEEILGYIRLHHAEPLTVAAVAAHFSYHPNYLTALIRAQTGETPRRYLLRCRVERAAALLASGEYNVSEAGAAVGLPDPKHFSKIFRQLSGKPPREMLPKG